ncbi:DUF5074 domain-containing protein [Ekhidna sp.]|uniref:DUF5074 domain-containing protein n=1 Tax=Ekhidna sp. TaxID=2608089 RepID=UPI003296D18C
MNRFLLKTVVLALIIGILCACSDDDAPLPLGEYDNGVVIINEGNFLEGDASISFYGRSATDAELNVFEGINGISLGDVAQSGYVYDTLLFVVVNNSNRVEVLHRYSMESLYTIEAALPRHITVANGKGYLTEWVSFSDAGRLSIVDLATGDLDGSVSVGFGAEDVEVVGNKAYVSNSFESTISVIDLTRNEVTETIGLGSPGPTQMEVDANGDLWVACKGGFDANFNPTNDGAIFTYDLSANTLEGIIAFEVNIPGKLAFNATKDEIYFYVDNTVFTRNVNSSSVSIEPFIDGEEFTSLYGIGVDPVTGEIYLADSKNFIEDGIVYKYNTSGALVSSFAVGRGPNGFVFN